jgi:hypothetical protein
MGINVQLPDDLTEGATREAARSFEGDVARLVTAAVRHYLTTQELAQTLLLAPALEDAGEPIAAQVDPFLLLRYLGVDDTLLADMVSGKVQAPEEAKVRFVAMGLSVELEAVLAGQALSAEDMAKLPPEVTALKKAPSSPVDPVVLLFYLGLEVMPDFEALRAGEKVELPDEVVAKYESIGLSVGLDALLAGQPVSGDDVVKLQHTVGAAAFVDPAVLAPGDSGDRSVPAGSEDTVARILARQRDLSDEQLAAAAAGIARVAERVAELRRGGR